MNGTVLNICIVLGLIMIEGLFVGAEIALVSLREGQARAMAESGRRGQAVARLLADPNRFLAAVQIGVTSTALLSSAFGAVTLSESAKQALVRNGVGETLSGVIGIVGVTLLISFVTLIVGELAPKRLGLQRPEGTALLFGPTLERIARLFRPLIWLLSKSTDLVVRVLGGDPHANRESISEEELRGLVAAHESLTTDERRLIDDVFAAGERSVSEVMISRTEVVFLEAGMTVSRAVKLTGGIVEVDGRCNLDEFAEYAGFELPEGPYETAGGFLMARLGKLPQVGDRVEINDHLVQVLEVEGRRASRLRVEPLPQPEAAATAG